MKKIIFILCVSIISILNSNGQWYVRQYHVNDINLLTKSQLEASLKKSKTDLLISGGIAGLGGVIFVIYKYVRPGMSDYPAWYEELIGDEGVNKLWMTVGAGILVAETIRGICQFGRIQRIRSVINRNDRSFGSINISPIIGLNSSTRTLHPGFSITYNF